MAKIFSFDRKEAESYARSLAKQRERERVAREEREIAPAGSGVMRRLTMANDGNLRALGTRPRFQIPTRQTAPYGRREKPMNHKAEYSYVFDEWRRESRRSRPFDRLRTGSGS
jgi:hypothetical protein